MVDLESEGVYDAPCYILPVWSPFCLSLLSSTSPPATSSRRDLLLITIVFHLSAWTCPAGQCLLPRFPYFICFLPRFPYFTSSLGSTLLKLMTTLTNHMTVHSRLMHRQCVLWTGDVMQLNLSSILSPFRNWGLLVLTVLIIGISKQLRRSKYFSGFSA